MFVFLKIRLSIINTGVLVVVWKEREIKIKFWSRCRKSRPQEAREHLQRASLQEVKIRYVVINVSKIFSSPSSPSNTSASGWDETQWSAHLASVRGTAERTTPRLRGAWGAENVNIQQDTMLKRVQFRIARDVPLEELHKLNTEMCRNVVIPSFLTACELMQEASHVPCLVSFRSTNYVEPEDRTHDDEYSGVDQAEEKPLSEDIQSFIKRNAVFIGKKVHGCTAYARVIDYENAKSSLLIFQKSEKSVWDLVIEAPEDSLYAGGIFFAEIRFNKENSYYTPNLKFKTLLLHPSLSGNGEVRIFWVVQPTVTCRNCSTTCVD